MKTSIPAHRVVNRLALCMALFVAFSLQSASQNNLTIGQVYDYNSGDQFHYYVYGAPPNATRFTITGRQASAAGDSVQYFRHYDNYSSQLSWDPEPHLEYYFQSYDDTLLITNPDSLISSLFGGYATNDTLGSWFADTTLLSATWCDVLCYSYSACLACNFEGHYYEGEYGAGIGLVRQLHQYPGWPATDYRYLLRYYKKGGTACGSPDFTTQSAATYLRSTAAEVSVFPNPATTQLHISQALPRTKTAFRIYSLAGKQLLQGSLPASEQSVDISALPAGMYFIQLSCDDTNAWLPFVKQ